MSDSNDDKFIRASRSTWEILNDHATDNDMTIKAAATDLIRKGQKYETHIEEVLEA